VVFFDVGQADATLLHNDGVTMLIDAGTGAGGQMIVNYLNQAGIDTIDWLVATHAHADHIGGMVTVMEEMEIGTMLDSGIPHTTQTYINYLEYIDDHDIPFHVPETGEAFGFGSADVTVVNSGLPGDSLHDGSLSLYIDYEGSTFLFTGDAETAGEQRIVDSFDFGSGVDVLQVGHHGSDTSSRPFFLDAVNPEMAVFSYGENNRYGHPHQVVVDRFLDRGTTLYSTAVSGHIEMTASNGQVTVHTAPWDGDLGDGDDGLININTAGSAELQQLEGIGPALAQNIIDHRNAHGLFQSIEQIMDVSGIGEARFAAIENDITV
jgi:competence protein ComEC